MTDLRNKKCKKCKCWRKTSDFIRKEKSWKTCNKCSRTYKSSSPQTSKQICLINNDSDNSNDIKNDFNIDFDIDIPSSDSEDSETEF